MKNNKGFTLIELLAVIVILGLLLAIAIPSITKYIVESRKKTVVSSIDGYMSSVIASVNEQEYKFNNPNTIYAIPIECIAVEKGGTNPLGEWLQANDDYWAYVLVQYDSKNFSYNYGFTFKDSSGYAMYPTAQSAIDSKSSTQIKTGLELTKPENGPYTNIAAEKNWTGFELNETTQVVVLEAEREGLPGDGETTCTLCQKGSNYQDVENEKNKRLINKIKNDNPVIKGKPNLTTSFNNTSDASGLYISTDTNTGKATYYFRGDVNNNYVFFANQTWRIIRINEDGTIRLIAESRVNNSTTTFNESPYSMYYSNSSNAKAQLQTWYNNNITKKGYDEYVVTSMFCEQAKVKFSSDFQGGTNVMTIYSSYIPEFKCSKDGKGFGIFNSKIGLITIDELIFAGGYPAKDDDSYYLINGVFGFWTMSPAGYDKKAFAASWVAYNTGSLGGFSVQYNLSLRPVISLKSDILATGTGTSSDPYVIQTN